MFYTVLKQIRDSKEAADAYLLLLLNNEAFFIYNRLLFFCWVDHMLAREQVKRAPLEKREH